MNIQPKPQVQKNEAPKSASRKGSAEYWEILSNIASGKEKVYSHDDVMAKLRKVLKR